MKKRRIHYENKQAATKNTHKNVCSTGENRPLIKDEEITRNNFGKSNEKKHNSIKGKLDFGYGCTTAKNDIFGQIDFVSKQNMEKPPGKDCCVHKQETQVPEKQLTVSGIFHPICHLSEKINLLLVELVI